MRFMWEWVFDGIGTELIGFIIGTITGGFAGYKIGVKNRSKQIQKAKDNADQKQLFRTKITGDSKDYSQLDSKINQSQKAGDGAVQVQIGGIRDE